MSAERLLFVQGSPGSGKSTLIRRFLDERSNRYSSSSVDNFVHVPVGAYVRGVLSGQYDSNLSTDIAQESASVQAMRLPSTDLVFSVFEELTERQRSGTTAIVDGFPREPEMISLIQHFTDRNGISVLGNIIVDTTDETALYRLMGRVSMDGHPLHHKDMAMRRIREYRVLTEPVANLLRDLWGGETIENNGTSIDVVSATFSKAAIDLANKRRS